MRARIRLGGFIGAVLVPLLLAPAWGQTTGVPTEQKSPVILALPKPMTGVFSGKVEFAASAFPIVSNQTASDVQTAIQAARRIPCRICRGTGVIAKEQSDTVNVVGPNKPVNLKWNDVCSNCAGFKDLYDAAYPQRLAGLVRALGHAPPGDQNANWRAGGASCLMEVFQIRQSRYVTHKGERFVQQGSSFVSGNNMYKQMTVGLKAVPEHDVAFSMDVSALVTPIWQAVRYQPPTGQPVLIVGATREPLTRDKWTFTKIDGELAGRSQPEITTVDAHGELVPSGSAGVPRRALRPAYSGLTTPAILLSGTDSPPVPAGRVVVGGLMVGKWKADAASGAAAGFRSAPPDGVPVILVVMSVGQPTTR